MFFRVLADHGDLISGYVVPDGFDGHCSIVVRSRGRDIAVRAANELRHDLAGLIDVGRHQTGACGFTIDDDVAPNLRAIEDLEIYEVETQTLVYRRPHETQIAKRLLRLESHLYPLWRLDAALNTHFQYSVNRIDSLGHETTTQILLPYDIQSVYISGRILHDKYRDYIERIFQVIFLMHHPLEELAERLVLLAQIKAHNKNVLSMRDNLSLRSAIEFAQSLAFHDETAFARQFRDVPHEVAKLFANPVARQLTVSSPDEMPRKNAVSRALDVMSSFALVGLRRAPRAVSDAVAEFVGIDAHYLPPLSNLPGVTALAKVLKRTRAADGLLEQDLELYQHVADAYRNAGLSKPRAR
jgi:hypothetical protein